MKRMCKKMGSGPKGKKQCSLKLEIPRYEIFSSSGPDHSFINSRDVADSLFQMYSGISKNRNFSVSSYIVQSSRLFSHFVLFIIFRWKGHRVVISLKHFSFVYPACFFLFFNFVTRRGNVPFPFIQ